LRWSVLSGRHRDNNVFALFAIGFWNLQDQFVLAQPEVCRLSDGKENGMLVVFRADAVDYALGLQGVFLAKQLLRLLVLTVSAEDFAGNGLAAFFL
jgi:hypothetical protein